MEFIKTYNQTNDLQYNTNLSLVRRYFKMLTWKPKESAIDIGMGDGKFTVQGLLPALPEDLETLIGCEYVPWKVDFAKINYVNPKVKFLQLDIATQQLPDDLRGRFDHVFSFFVLNWVHDLRTALSNMFLMMKPGAEFLILVVEKGMDKVMHGISQYPRWSSYGHSKSISAFFDVEDRLPLWRNILQETGFVDLNCFKENMVYQQKSKEVSDEMFKALNPVSAEIPPEDLEDYYKDFVTELYRSGLCRIEICPETKQEIATTNFAAIIVYGKKPEVS